MPTTSKVHLLNAKGHAVEAPPRAYRHDIGLSRKESKRLPQFCNLGSKSAQELWCRETASKPVVVLRPALDISYVMICDLPPETSMLVTLQANSALMIRDSQMHCNNIPLLLWLSLVLIAFMPCRRPDRLSSWFSHPQQNSVSFSALALLPALPGYSVS